MPLLEFRFVLSSLDVLTGMRVMQAQSLGFRVLMLAIGVCAVISWGFALITREEAVHALALALTVLGAFLLVYQLIVVPWTLTNELGMNDHVRAESTWHVDPYGITIHAAQKRTFLLWSDFACVLETPAHYLFVYVSDRHQFQIVPRRALTPDQARTLARLIAAHVPEPVRSRFLPS
jgi:hypothetical protein